MPLTSYSLNRRVNNCATRHSRKREKANANKFLVTEWRRPPFSFLKRKSSSQSTKTPRTKDTVSSSSSLSVPNLSIPEIVATASKDAVGFMREGVSGMIPGFSPRKTIATKPQYEDWWSRTGSRGPLSGTSILLKALESDLSSVEASQDSTDSMSLASSKRERLLPSRDFAVKGSVLFLQRPVSQEATAGQKNDSRGKVSDENVTEEVLLDHRHNDDKKSIWDGYDIVQRASQGCNNPSTGDKLPGTEKLQTQGCVLTSDLRRLKKLPYSVVSERFSEERSPIARLRGSKMRTVFAAPADEDATEESVEQTMEISFESTSVEQSFAVTVEDSLESSDEIFHWNEPIHSEIDRAFDVPFSRLFCDAFQSASFQI